MPPILISLITAAASVLGFYLAIHWSKWRVADLRAASGHMDEAYEAAQKLIKNPATPETVIRFTEFFSSKIGTPFFARGFALHLISGEISRSPTSAETRQFMADLNSLDGERKSAFAKMIAAGMVSSAASDPIFSRFYLLAVHSFLSSSGREDGAPSQERAQTVATDLVASSRQRELVLA